jgi:tight adherence protein B
VAYGRSLDEALTEMTKRVPQSDLRYLVNVVQIQHQAGGNLAEVLKNLGSVIRSRFHMFARIKAISAEGRLSCMVIGILPLAMGIILTILRPDYYAAVSGHRLFWVFIGAIPVMLLSGWFTMWRMVNFKI